MQKSKMSNTIDSVKAEEFLVLCINEDAFKAVHEFLFKYMIIY